MRLSSRSLYLLMGFIALALLVLIFYWLPLAFAMLAIAGTGAVAILLVVVRARTSLSRISTSVDYLERETSKYGDYEEYLRRKARLGWLGKIDAILVNIERIHSDGWLIATRQAPKINKIRGRAEAVKAFLESYLDGYASHEVRRHQNFFENAKLDREQTSAVLVNDDHNLVVAAAGSGKTKTLTTRIAYLVEKGVPPERILALAYTNDAADEMRSRLVSQYGVRTAEVMTLHKFSRDLAKKSPKFRSDVAGQTEQSKFIRSAAEKLSAQDRGFAVKLLNFATDLEVEERQEHEFPAPEQYIEYLSRQDYVTLNMVRVKSLAEREIGNFLFLNGIEFTYEAKAAWADKSPDYRDYHPDFFLPAYNLWIEHWAIDREGRVPDWFSSGNFATPSDRYKAGMKYKKEQFRNRDQKLLETFHYQYSEGTLISDLEGQLATNGVATREIPMQEILARIDRLIRRDPLYELMFSFIRRAKTNGLTMHDLEERLGEKGKMWTRRQKNFASLMIPIWKEYESQLNENNMLDFSDMITLALEVARRDRQELATKYSHVLVDEFQDITDPQLEVIQCLRSEGKEGNVLYCVGDHRQNVFSFAGSNVLNILEFDKRFPYPEKMTLSTNYRCPKNVVEASNAVIAAGSCRDRPSVPASTEVRPIKIIEKTDGSHYEDWELSEARVLLGQLLASKRPEEEILVLARYNFRIESLKIAFPDHRKMNLNFKTVHSAKGTEADYVLVLGCVGGRFGFPTKVLEENLLDIVSMHVQSKNEKLEEERRLFYVAITRCRKQLYLFTSKWEKSQFVSELDSILNPPPPTPVPVVVPPRKNYSPNKLAMPIATSRKTLQTAKFCTQCGKRMQMTDNFCISCGTLQTWKGESAARPKSYSVEAVRERFHQAYAKWDTAEDQALKSEFGENLDINSIAKRHERKPGAIRSRLKKLGLLNA
jgi:DNA helicase IV